MREPTQREYDRGDREMNNIYGLTEPQRKALAEWAKGSGSPRVMGARKATARALLDKGLLAMQGAVFTRDCVLYITDAGRRAVPK